MGLKKKNKVSADFNMSSLTDIIFLLLIFFMLTSSVVTPSSLNLTMPGKSKSTITVDTKPKEIIVRRDGSFSYNGKKLSESRLERTIQDMQRNNKGKKLNLTISPQKGAPTKSVVAVMETARVLGANGILTVAK